MWSRLIAACVGLLLLSNVRKQRTNTTSAAEKVPTENLTIGSTNNRSVEIIATPPKDPLDQVAKELAINALFLNPCFFAWRYETNYAFTSGTKVMAWNGGTKVPYSPFSVYNTLDGIGLGSWVPLIFTFEHSGQTPYLLPNMSHSINTIRKNYIQYAGSRNQITNASLRPDLSLGMPYLRYDQDPKYNVVVPAHPHVGMIYPYDKRDPRTVFSSRDLYEIIASEIYDVIRTKRRLKILVGNWIIDCPNYFNLLERYWRNDKQVTRVPENVGAWLPLAIHNTGVEAVTLNGDCTICTRLKSRRPCFIVLDNSVVVNRVYKIKGGVNVKAIDFSITRNKTFTIILPKDDGVDPRYEDLISDSLAFAVHLRTSAKGVKCYYMEV